MRIKYTLHAKEQILARKLHRVWVEETVRYPDETRKKLPKVYAIKKLNGITLKVVYTKQKYIKIITVFTI